MQTQTKTSTRTKVMVGVAAVGLAAAAAFGSLYLVSKSKTRCGDNAYKCTEWTQCKNGVQVRTCRLVSWLCKMTPKPQTSKKCDMPRLDVVPMPPKDVELASPTFGVVPLPSTLMATGPKTVARISASAVTAAPAGFRELSFLVGKSTGVIISAEAASSLRIVGEGRNLAGTAELVSCGADAISCVLNLTLDTTQVIDPGTTRTYELQMNIGVPLPCESEIATKLSAPTMGAVQTLSGDIPCPVFEPPTFSMVGLPSTVLTAGSVIPYRFVATAGDEDATFRTLSFDIDKNLDLSLSAVSASSIYRVGFGSPLAGTASLRGCGAGSSIGCTVDVVLESGYVVPAHASHVFDLRLNVADVPCDSSLSTNLSEPAELGAATMAGGPSCPAGSEPH